MGGEGVGGDDRIGHDLRFHLDRLSGDLIDHVLELHVALLLFLLLLYRFARGLLCVSLGLDVVLYVKFYFFSEVQF